MKEETCNRSKLNIFEAANTKKISPELEKHLNECRECGNVYVAACFFNSKK